VAMHIELTAVFQINEFLARKVCRDLGIPEP
jgi:hypothetical protein